MATSTNMKSMALLLALAAALLSNCTASSSVAAAPAPARYGDGASPPYDTFPLAPATSAEAPMTAYHAPVHGKHHQHAESPAEPPAYHNESEHGKHRHHENSPAEAPAAYPSNASDHKQHGHLGHGNSSKHHGHIGHQHQHQEAPPTPPPCSSHATNSTSGSPRTHCCLTCRPLLTTHRCRLLTTCHLLQLGESRLLGAP
ncbi:hypothetical protein ACQ4PT_020210 [Festuca glaucescens]